VTVPGISAAQWRELVRVTDTETGPSRRQTIELAGFQLALAALDILGEQWAAARVLVLAGPGGTGATGIGAARHLANRGIEVTAVSARRPAEADGVLGQQLLTLAETPARLLPFSAAFDVATFDLVIDAVLGRGIDGAPRTAALGLIRATEAATGPVLSADLPSGLDPDSGTAAGTVVHPSHTLAFGLPARGLSETSGGMLWLADIGLTPGAYARAGLVVPPLFGATARLSIGGGRTWRAPGDTSAAAGVARSTRTISSASITVCRMETPSICTVRRVSGMSGSNAETALRRYVTTASASTRASKERLSGSSSRNRTRYR
jgi:NAD(P)H-hydrate epimerase